MGTRSIYRELGQHHAPLVRPLGEASRRAEPEPASGRASKLWLPTARVVDIGYCGYGEPLGSAGEGHTGFRRDLARPWSPYGDQGGKRVNHPRSHRYVSTVEAWTTHRVRDARLVVIRMGIFFCMGVRVAFQNGRKCVQGDPRVLTDRTCNLPQHV